MSTQHPRSFRRLLILRLLLLGIPILLIGQYVTLRKARTGLLETARQNLANSAVHRAKLLQQDNYLVVGQLRTMAQTETLRKAELEAITAKLMASTSQTQLSSTCFQLLGGSTNQTFVSTCDAASPLPNAPFSWNTTAQAGSEDFAFVAMSSYDFGPNQIADADQYTQFEMVWAAPVYTVEGALKYTLLIRTKLTQLENVSARSLVGYTVVLDSNDQVIIHPDISLEGQSVEQLGDRDRLQSIQRAAQSGQKATLHLFQFLPSYPEWLAGYSSFDMEVTPGEVQQWTVLAVTPLSHALQGLADIRNVLVFFTLGLLIAQILLVLYLAQRLSRPVERLCDYAQEIQDLANLKPLPQNFQVWEFNHLAKAFNKMMKRLEQRAHALQHAWRDAQVANQLKSEFLANTSHELRTPLNAIIGCVRLVKDDCCDSEEEAQEFLDTADQAAIHLLGIINDILDIAKVEAGTMEVNLCPINVQQVVDEVTALQSVQAQQKGLELRCLQAAAPLWAMADPAKLKQVLLNLVYNATKFTDSGEIVLEAHLENSDEESAIQWPSEVSLPVPFPRIVIQVSDTGVGIDPTQQKKLFQPFVMADGSTTRQHEGTGLGLAISRNLITLMGGAITLYSPGLGKGTRVILALPMVPPSKECVDPSNDRLPSTTHVASDASAADEEQAHESTRDTIPSVFSNCT
ncbi:MAG: ATP-binding protein [Cyanobacteria bacterium J06638_28]